MQSKKGTQILDSFYLKCKQHNLKITPQRVAIYKELVKLENHPSAEQLYRIVNKQYPNISHDTINRTLITFAEIGIVDVVEGFGSPKRYDSKLESHHHAHCIQCGAILDFYNDEYDNIEIPKAIKNRFKIVSKRVILNGICKKCGTKNKDGKQ